MNIRLSTHVHPSLMSPIGIVCMFPPHELQRNSKFERRRVSLVHPSDCNFTNGMTGVATGLTSMGRNPSIEVSLDGSDLACFKRRELYFPDDPDGYNQDSLAKRSF